MIVASSNANYPAPLTEFLLGGFLCIFGILLFIATMQRDLPRAFLPRRLSDLLGNSFWIGQRKGFGISMLVLAGIGSFVAIIGAIRILR
jgi:hypothetical protein